MGFAGDDIGFSADNVQNNVLWEVATELGQPGTHVGKRLGGGYVVAEDAGIGTTVVEAGDGAKSFLSGW